MIDVKQFSGVMDTDSSNDNISPTSHKRARNVVFRGVGKAMRPQNVPGTRLISNSLLPAGSNQCIGSFFDALRQRVFSFNYNSNGNHGVYLYNLPTASWSRLIEVGINTDGDILGFTLTQTIYNVNILYGDTNSIRGDLLYYIDSLMRPCTFSINRASTGAYGTIKRSYLDVAKEPPSIQPNAVYGDDNTITVNNLRKRLFRFKYRFVFGNQEKSVWSSISEVPLPIDYIDSDIDTNPSKNCVIRLILQTGTADVKKIEVAASQSEGNGWSDFFLVQTLDKAALLAINPFIFTDDSLYLWNFYNDQAYTTINVAESLLAFDWVPLKANAQELLNGNIPIYGGLTEGYDYFSVDAVASVSTVVAGNSNLNFVFQGSQDGNPGFGTGAIVIALSGTVDSTDTFNIQTTSSTFTVTGHSTSAGVLADFESQFLGAGYTINYGSDTTFLKVTKNGEALQLVNAIVGPAFTVNNGSAYDWYSRYGFAIEYEDEKGRTFGASTNQNMTVQTLGYAESGGLPLAPIINISITSRPPIWARRFRILRTKNLTKERTRDWITSRTLKDDKFAYISIASLYTFKAKNPEASVNYSFAPQDRICFYKNEGDGTVYTDKKDYEILSSEIDPVVSGAIQTGTWLKIALPTTDSNFDFGAAFSNYFINLYTPAKSIGNSTEVDADNNNFYYEFGETYGIGNAGTVNAFHQGQLQNQSLNLLTPATFSFQKGDVYYRNRSIDVGQEFVYNVTAGQGSDSDAGRITVGLTLISTTNSDPNLVGGNSPYQNLIGFDLGTDTTRQFLTVTSGTYVLTITGRLTITFTDALPGDAYTFFIQTNNGVITTLVPEFDSSAAQTYTFAVNQVFSMTGLERIFIFGYSVPGSDHTRSFTATQLTVRREVTITQGMIDQNFSDYFDSAVNSNGRSWTANPDQQQVYIPNILRWGLPYEPNTNINQSNRFFPLNFDEIDRQKGDIRRMKVRDRDLRIFQSLATAVTGIYAKYIQDSSGGNQLTTTDQIITSNNVRYYEGNFGMNDMPTGLISGKIADYFFDTVRGYWVRLSRDGLTPLNEIFFGKYEIRNLILQYNDVTNARPTGGYAKIMGAINYLEEEVVAVFQDGTDIAGDVLSFNEQRKGFSSFFDYKAAESIVAVNENIYMFLGGEMYAADDTANYCKFFGTQYYPSVEVVHNDKVSLVKTFNSIGYDSNNYWVPSVLGDIKTGFIDAGTGLQQVSKLFEVDFSIDEGKFHAYLLRDSNSMTDADVALWEGSYLKSTWASVKYTYSGADFAYLYLPFCQYSISPKTP